MKLFRSYRAKWKAGENFYLKDIARATSAAPTYFPMKKVRSIDEGKEFSLVDGGMAVNNPAFIALAEAYNLYGPERQINLISLGTGERTGYVREAKEVSYVRRASQVIDALFDSQSHAIHKTLTELSISMPNQIKYHRVQISLEERLMALDNANNIKQLSSKAENWFDSGEGQGVLNNVKALLHKTLKERKAKEEE